MPYSQAVTTLFGQVLRKKHALAYHSEWVSPDDGCRTHIRQFLFEKTICYMKKWKQPLIDI